MQRYALCELVFTSHVADYKAFWEYWQRYGEVQIAEHVAVVRFTPLETMAG